MIELIQNFVIRNMRHIPYFFKRSNDFYFYQDNYALIGKLSASIIHDILTPINSLSLLTNLKNKSIVELEPIIKNSTKQINEFIEIMKDFLYQSNFESQIHINKEILKCIKLLTHKAIEQNIQIQFIEFDQVYTKINPLYIYQVIINLISNAIEASATSAVKKIIIILKKENNSFQIDCKDFGIGIESKIIKQICKPNFTTKETGHGLGLYSVKYIVTMYLGGQLKIHSEPQNGSLFSCIIPLLK